MTANASVGAILIAVVGIASCSSEPTPPDGCTAPGLVFTPAAPAVAVGDTLRLSTAYASGAALCTPHTPANQLRWTSSNASVAQVDSIGALVTGAQAGSAYLHVHAPGQPVLADSLLVRVYVPLFNRIVFTSTPPVPCPATDACVAQLRSARPDGSDVRVIATAPQYPTHARVAPDGRHVIFNDQNQAGGASLQLYIADAADGSISPFVTGTTAAADPSWSPDGQWILFDGPLGVYIIHPDGTGRRLVNSSGDVNPSQPAWAPDGNRVVYMTAGQAVIADLAGTTHQVVTQGITAFNGNWPEWSPDGTTLIFLGTEVCSGNPCRWATWSLDLGSGAYQMLALDVGNFPGSWSSDGQRIVFGSGDVEVMDRDGGNRQTLVADSRANFSVSSAPREQP